MNQPVRLLCYMSLWTGRYTTFNSIPIIQIILTNKKSCITSFCHNLPTKNKEQRIVHHQGALNINFSTVLIFIDVQSPLPMEKPIPYLGSTSQELIPQPTITNQEAEHQELGCLQQTFNDNTKIINYSVNILFFPLNTLLYSTLNSPLKTHNFNNI